MYKEKVRINKIINELLSFLLKENATSIHININDSDNEVKITILGNVKDFNKDKLNKLKRKLIGSRSEGIEELFWELVGDMNINDELNLLGTMIDESSIDLINSKCLKICVLRKKLKKG
ncbi:MAG: hypothetical protein FH753_16825 [Firmicutes bacterium]|nr:hypothetical protein [Bacillota bacterium]